MQPHARVRRPHGVRHDLDARNERVDRQHRGDAPWDAPAQPCGEGEGQAVAMPSASEAMAKHA